MASVVKQRDLLADAAQVAPRTSRASNAVSKVLAAAAVGAPMASSGLACKQQEVSTRGRARPVTPSLAATKQSLACAAPRPQSAMQ